jgi:glycerol-1-phosphate dehydrogenase [NAD(P)+]
MIYAFYNIPIFLEIEMGKGTTLEDMLKRNNIYFSKPLLITGANSLQAISKYKDIQNIATLMIETNEMGVVDKVKDEVIKKGYDVIIGCGGGKVIDVGKMASREALTPFLSIPTILSSDSIASPISVIEVNGENKSIGSSMPTGILINIDVIKDGPEEYLKAGLGDVISNISASADWELAHKKTAERYDNFSRIMALLPAERMVDNSHRYQGLKDDLFLKHLAEGLALSGIAMSIAKSSRPASGSEHTISHAMDRILKEKRRHHGIQVGFATLLTTYLQKQYEVSSKIKGLFRGLGFPQNFEELGVSREAFLEAVTAAPTIRTRYTILDEVEFPEIERAIDKVYE